MTGVQRCALPIFHEVIGGVDKIRIEEEDYVYDDEVILDISDDLNPELVTKKFIADRTYSGSETGYQKYEYEQTGGLSEFNTKSIWTTVKQNVQNVLKLVSKIRGDTQGIKKLMLSPLSADGTLDVKGEDDMFMIDSVRDGLDFKARTDEGFDFVGGGVDAGQSYNLARTPKRILIAHGKRITAGLLNSLNSYIKWQNTEKNTTLSTKLTTEADIVVENEDVFVNDLEESRIMPFDYSFEIPLTPTQLYLLDQNRHKLIKFGKAEDYGTDMYGWREEWKTGNKDRLTEMTLSLANLNVVTPT